MCLKPELRKPSRIKFDLAYHLTSQQLQALLMGDITEMNSLPMQCLAWDNFDCRCDDNWRILDSHYSLDHIIPKSRGGINHHHNFFLMPRSTNCYFGNSWTAEKVAYIGLEAAVAAGKLRWQSLRVKTSLHGLVPLRTR
jgi:hypothetical protein